MQNMFLPYQQRWLKDKSRFKLVEKSRRTGFTWIQSLEDVQDALTLKVRNKPVNVWFSSADASASYEYIRYCEEWARAVNTAVKLEETNDKDLIDEKTGFKALSLTFNNGARITALSSNPKGFRSKGGKVVIDEFAFHDNPAELWKAAKPVISWGYPLRIISTLNGTNNLYYQFVKRIKEGKLNWSLHTVDIYTAVNEGLADKILDKKLSEAERLEWLENEKKGCADEAVWSQEYCCIPIDENSAFLTYELINSSLEDTLIDDLSECKGDLFLGYDVGRIKDLSVISVFEKLGSVFYLRKLIEFQNVRYRDQKEVLYRILSLNNLKKASIDATGIGSNLAEDAEIDFGKRKVEKITFNLKTKEELAYGLLTKFQDNNIRIPDNDLIKADLHSIKRIPTSTGAIKFNAARSETDGHADRFWSFALGVFAGTNEPYQNPVIYSKKPKLYTGFDNELNLNGFRGILRGVYN